MTLPSYREQKLAASEFGLDDGDTYRGRCPFCHRQNTYSVNRASDYVMWNCFSASCSVHGMYQSTGRSVSVGYVGPEQTRPIKHTPRPYNPSDQFDIPKYFTEIPNGSTRINNILISTNSVSAIQQSRARVMFDPHQRRLVFLIQDVRSDVPLAVYGAVGKGIWPDVTPPWYNYHQTCHTPLIIPKKIGEKTETLLLVEDPLSACNGSHLVDTLALGGTTFHAFFAPHLKEYKNLILALDRDATIKALDLRRKLNILKPTRMLFLEEDIKLWNHKKLCKRLVPYL